MKSIRDRLAMLLMLCLLVWGAVPALAAETVDETRIGSIKVLLCDTETAAPLQGGELTLYRVASVSKNGADMSLPIQTVSRIAESRWTMYPKAHWRADWQKR